MENLVADFKYGIRMILRNPGFSAVAIVVLALGIGANTAIFSVVNSVLLSRLPYRNPDRLVLIWHHYPDLKLDKASLSPPSYVEYRDLPHCFESVMAASEWSANLTGIGEPERVEGIRATSTFFSTLGAEPEAGRTFVADEDKPGSDNVVVISHALAARKFGSAAAAVNRTVQLNNQTYTVIGVMPPNFVFFTPADVWKPIAFTPDDLGPANHGDEYLASAARLRSGVTFQQAQSEMNSLADSLRPKFYSSDSTWGITISPLRDELFGKIRPALLIVLGAVVLVLLIACSNVASMLLARSTAREKEIAIRASLGASRLRVIRQLLTESVLLALVGAIFGSALAFAGVGLLVSSVPHEVAQFIYGWKNIGVDYRALAFTAGLAILTGLIFGIAPAVQSARVNLNDPLKEGGRGGSAGARGNRLRSLLVIAEVALALVLLISAGLLIRSFSKLQEVSGGLNPQNVLTFRVSLPKAHYKEDSQINQFYKQALDGLSHAHGVTAASVVSVIPMGQSHWNASFDVEGYEHASGQAYPHGDPYIISPDYFKVLQIPLLRGRFFNEHDQDGSTPVAIVDDTLAQQYWPGQDAIGKHIAMSADKVNDKPVWREIVGIVAHVKDYGIDGITKNQYYFPAAQKAFEQMAFLVKTDSDPNLFLRSASDVIHSVDSDQPLFDVQTMQDIYNSSMADKRFAMSLLGVFSAIALVLALVGIYGVMSYVVTQRTHEIGIRMAIGASTGNVLALMVRQGLLLAGIGVVIGLAGSFAATRALSGLLFGVGATDSVTFVAVSGLLAAAVVAASLIPAGRATRVNPVEALRYE